MEEYQCLKCNTRYATLKDYRKCCTMKNKFPARQYSIIDDVFKVISASNINYYVFDNIYVFNMIAYSSKTGEFVGNYDSTTNTIRFINDNILLVNNITIQQEEEIQYDEPYTDEKSRKYLQTYIKFIRKNKTCISTVIFAKLTPKYKQLYLNILVTSNQDPELYKTYFARPENYEHLFETLKLAIQLQKKDVVFAICGIISDEKKKNDNNPNLSINWSLLQYEAKLTANMDILSRLMFEDFASQI